MAKNPVTSVDHAIELLEKAVESRGADYIYAHPDQKPDQELELCKYVHGDECGCIIGCALTFNGWTLGELAPYEKKSIGVIAEDNGFDRGAASVLTQAQLVQDGVDISQLGSYIRDVNHSWGKALAGARVRAEQIRRDAPETEV